jgi:hypothetical protein
LDQLDLFGNLQLFADDTALSYPGINADLLSIGNWLLKNELGLNVLKSAHMVFENCGLIHLINMVVLRFQGCPL